MSQKFTEHPAYYVLSILLDVQMWLKYGLWPQAKMLLHSALNFADNTVKFSWESQAGIDSFFKWWNWNVENSLRKAVLNAIS